MNQTTNPTHRIRVGKIPFEVSTLDQAVRRIVIAAQRSEALPVRLSNAYCVALASTDPDYAVLLNDEGLNYPDGAPVVFFMRRWAARNLRPERVRGPSLFREALKSRNSGDLHHFFLGTTQDTLDKLTKRLLKDDPAIQIAGSHPPPFSELDELFYQSCVDKITATNAQLVWVALGTPKQDFVAAEISRRIHRPCIAVGAAFDFAAGTVPEAPYWMQQTGSEWIYRLFSEPRRLWKRYLFGNARFLASAVFESRTR